MVFCLARLVLATEGAPRRMGVPASPTLFVRPDRREERQLEVKSNISSCLYFILTLNYWPCLAGIETCRLGMLLASVHNHKNQTSLVKISQNEAAQTFSFDPLIS